MFLAGVDASGTGETDRVLSSVVARLMADGTQVLGALRVRSSRQGHDACDSTLKILPKGPDIQITQDLGACSSSCRMDAGAIEDAVGLATTRLLVGGAELVVINKFGLREAEGRGFRSLIAAALSRNVPVLVGVTETHRPAFLKFAGGMATILKPSEKQVLAWCRNSVAGGKVHPVDE